MTIITKGMGAIIKGISKSKKVINRTTKKPFSKSTQDHMKAADKRKAGMKKAGYKGPHYTLGKQSKSGAYKLKENWSYNPYKKARPHGTFSSFGKDVLKKGAPVAAAGAAGVAYGQRGKK